MYVQTRTQTTRIAMISHLALVLTRRELQANIQQTAKDRNNGRIVLHMKCEECFIAWETERR